MSIQATIIGRLTKDPEVKQSTKTGTWYCNVSIAVNHGKNQQGEDETTFVELTAYGKTGEVISKLQKGGRVSVASDLKLEKWVSQTGAAGATLRGNIRSVDIIDWPENTQQGAPQAAQGYNAPAPAPAGYPQQNYQQAPMPGFGAPAPIPGYQQPPVQQPPVQQQPYQQPVQQQAATPPVAATTPWGR